MGEKPRPEGYDKQQEPAEEPVHITFNLGKSFDERLLPILDEHQKEYQRSAALSHIPREVRELLSEE